MEAPNIWFYEKKKKIQNKIEKEKEREKLHRFPSNEINPNIQISVELIFLLRGSHFQTHNCKFAVDDIKTQYHLRLQTDAHHTKKNCCRANSDLKCRLKSKHIFEFA